MNDLIPWTECQKDFIRKVSPDPEKVAALVEAALARRDFLKSILVNEKNASFIIEGYYEIIKELLVALLLQQGMRSQNHQCLFSFFAKEYGYDAEVNLIQHLNHLRNRLDYYGELIDYTYFQENYKSFERAIKLLLGLIKR